MKRVRFSSYPCPSGRPGCFGPGAIVEDDAGPFVAFADHDEAMRQERNRHLLEVGQWHRKGKASCGNCGGDPTYPTAETLADPEPRLPERSGCEACGGAGTREAEIAVAARKAVREALEALDARLAPACEGARQAGLLLAHEAILGAIEALLFEEIVGEGQELGGEG